jgi:hypothetical protein
LAAKQIAKIGFEALARADWMKAGEHRHSPINTDATLGSGGLILASRSVRF